MIRFVILWSIAGYPLIAGLTALIGIDNGTVSIAFRALTAVCAGMLALALPKNRPDAPLVLFMLFWLAYLLRLLLNLHIYHEPLSRPVQDYWIWAIGACLLPALATLRSANVRTATQLRMSLLLVVMVAIMLTMSQGSTAFVQATGEVTDINRWNLGSLNPIATGHLGATGVLLGIGILLTGSRSRIESMLALGSVPTGLYLAILANSRGPIVALAVCVITLVLASGRYGKAQFLVLVGIGLVACLAIFVPSASSILAGLTDRFDAIQSGNDLSAIGRTISFQGAIDQFFGSPLFGDGIEERVTGYYPHNLVLEAFMATGVIGGIPFTLFLFLSLRSSWKLFRIKSENTWVGLLAIQYIVAAQFSGSIYLSTAMWTIVSLSIVLSRQFKEYGHGV